MLESLSIKNFRSCEDVRIRMGEPVIALVGKNGVGKTNLLHAIQLVTDLCVGEPDSVFNLHPRDRSSPTEFELGFVIKNSHYIYSVSRTSPPGENEVFKESLIADRKALFRRNGESLEAHGTDLPPEFRVGLRAASLPTLLQILPQEGTATSMLRPVSDYLRAVRYYPLLQTFQEHTSDVSPFIIEARGYEKWKAQLVQGVAPRSVQMRLVHMWLADKGRFDEFKTLLGSNGLGLIEDMRVEEIKFRRSERNEEATEPAYSISFIPGTGLAGAGTWFRFSGLSAGTLRIVQLLTYLIFDQASCMLLEQPEDCIHPGLLAKVIDILRTYSGRTQLICTTHSPRVLNLVGAKAIRFVIAHDGKTSVSELSADQLISAGKYLADEGTLAEFLDTL